MKITKLVANKGTWEATGKMHEDAARWAPGVYRLENMDKSEYSLLPEFMFMVMKPGKKKPVSFFSVIEACSFLEGRE